MAEQKSVLPEEPPKKKRFPKRVIVYLILGVILVLGLDQRMIVRQYHIDAPEITAPIRIVQVSDLHSCRYGEGEQGLLDAIAAQHPDLVLLTGDIFDDELPDDNTIAFLEGISGKYPVWYVTGNHEFWGGREAYAQKMEILSRYEIQRLAGTSEEVTVNGNTLTICGVDDPEKAYVNADYGFEQQLRDVKPDGAHYTILLSHRPERFEDYVTGGFDLVFTGHAHGGQCRVPGLINGVFAPDQGLFPKYAGGLYEEGGTTMIVSRGLARESTPVPRHYNRPELVVVDLE